MVYFLKLQYLCKHIWLYDLVYFSRKKKNNAWRSWVSHGLPPQLGYNSTDLLDAMKGGIPTHSQRNVNRVGQKARQVHAVGRRGRPVVPSIRTARRRNHCFDISSSEFTNYPHTIFHWPFTDKSSPQRRGRCHQLKTLPSID